MRNNANVLICILSITFLFSLISSSQGQEQSYDYLLKKYKKLHHSQAQEKFEKIAPTPVGAVYVMRPGETEEDIREHFRTMKELGYTCLKQLMTTPEWDEEKVKLIALEEGIIPWWYGQGGWQAITDELLKKLDIPLDTPIEEIRNHPAMLKYQKKVMRERVKRTMKFEKNHPNKEAPGGSSRAFEPEIGGTETELTEKGEKLYVNWAKDRYQTTEKLNDAYNQHHAGLNIGENGEIGFQSWKDFENNWKTLPNKEYRHLRDIFRFKADHGLKNIRKDVEKFTELYPHAPYRGGGELGLFYPQTWYNVDLEGIADIMANYGTFYPSMHYSWHFSRVDNEILKPTYMQASYATDIFKGGWAAAWESTGGPQYFSGSGHGFKVDDHTMTQFLLSHIAAGFKGFGLWAWSARTAGWEAGEYSLLTRHNKVTPRAKKVGKIGQALQNHRDEVWNAYKEPYVGVFADWNNEAIWTAISIHGDSDFKMYPIEARIGASRALINGDVPFEYVTASDLKNGLAQRYRVIYLPAILSLKKETLKKLETYVKNGGRLVLDMPGAWYNQYTELLYTNEGTIFEKIFGATIHDYQKADKNRPNSIGDFKIEGVTAGITPHEAEVIARFTDLGEPAITKYKYGDGTAVILGYPASHLCFEPGNKEAEKHLRKYALGPYDTPYSCKDAIVYRLAAPGADHYFLLNPGEERDIKLKTRWNYKKAVNAITQKAIQQDQTIHLESHSGKWLRFIKK